MSEELTDVEVREGAICLLAYEGAVCDERSAEEAVADARRLCDALDTEPWKDGKHSGDCTKQAHTCIRCMVEGAEAKARRMFDE